MPPMRLPGRRGSAAPQRPSQIPSFIVCPVCHLRNEITARFCRDCGLPLGAPRDPVRGTTTRRAELPSDRGAGVAALFSLLAIVVIAGVAGFLVFRGFDAGSTTAAATATPRASGDPQASGPAGSGALIGASPVTATNEPLASDEAPESDGPDPFETSEPTDEPVAETPPVVPTSTRFTCGDASIQDPLAGRWRITQARWSEHSAFDRVTLDLVRTSGSTRDGATVAQDFIKPAKAVAQYGVAAPTGGRALVVTFDGPITLRAPMSAQPELTAVKSLEARRDADGVVHLVIGVEGEGCARMLANDWRDGSEETMTAQLAIDVRR